MVAFTVKTVATQNACNMKIETKFNMGDSAFVMYNNKAVPILIMGVHYSLDRYAGEITYYSANISTGNGLERFKEKEVFKTKKELLESL